MAGLGIAGDACVIATSTGELQAFVRGRAFAIDGAGPDEIRALLALADGTRTKPQLLDELGEKYDAGLLSSAIDALIRAGVLVEAAETPGREPRPAVTVLGNGRLLEALDAALQAAGYEKRTLLRPASIEPLIGERMATRVLSPLPSLAAPARAELVDGLDDRRLAEIMRGAGLVICALEGVVHGALLKVNRAALEARTPCLFLTASDDEALLGPLVLGGGAPCYGCRLLSLGPFAHLVDSLPFVTTPALSSLAGGFAVAVALAAVELLGDPRAASVVQRVVPNGNGTVSTLLSEARCPACAERKEGPLAAAIASSLEIARVWPVSPQANLQPRPDAYRTVAIVGGGTAGYLTALALRRHRPELEVTLIESSAIPIIGVGEATTPEMVKFLHSSRFLGREITDFFRRVRPTWKLGIKFKWGPRDFAFPFQRGRLLEAKLHDGHLDRQSLGSMLMMADRAPIFLDDRGAPVSLAHIVRWAYHLDNERFVAYLAEEARRAGIAKIDAKIVAGQLSEDGQSVRALVAEDGRTFEHDLYIDCSGFRSLLIEKVLGSRYFDYGSTLFTDSAIAANVPHDGTIKPYTLAESMNAGWCWNIPFEDSDHRGYVFASRFLDPEAAEAEMRAKNPGMSEGRLIRFRSGRHEHFFKGNVVAMGNSYAFVEPLESTALHMIVLQIELLITHFPESRRDEGVKAALNRKVAARWDALRWFLGIHYKFNRRLDTPFWSAVHADADVSGAEERLHLYRERAPLSYRTSLFYTVYPPEFFSDDHSFDTLLMGQDLDAHYVQPLEDRATWERRAAVLERMTAAALPQARALDYLREAGPEEIEKLRTRGDSWLHGWVPA